MTCSIHHRGPDSQGQIATDFASIGFRRLSIIDLTSGDQPLANEDGTIECFLNGEIFNYKELRRELISRGHRLTTQSDTEVIPHLYEDYGDAMFAKLNGMFSICVVDKRSRQVLVARDQIGVKQMYYARVGGAVLFGSEMKALLASGLLEPQLDAAGVLSYLSLFYCPEPHTLVRGVMKVPPGSFMRLAGGESRIERYYKLPVATVRMSEADATARTAELLKEAVAGQLQADVPVGISLSGGVDSSAIAFAATQTDAARPLALTIDWPTVSSEEVDSARLLCSGLGLRHEVIRPSMASAFDDLPLLAWLSDEPVADPATYSQYAVARAASDHVKVLLSGAGGDELFGGYTTYVANWKWGGFAMLPPPLQRALHTLGASRWVDKEWLAALAEYRRSRLRWHSGAMSSLSGDDRLFIAGHLKESRNPFENFRKLFDEYASSDGVTQQMLVDLRTYLPDQVLPMLDRTTMAASIEGRVPLLDVPLVEFAFSMSGSMKLGSPVQPKRLLKNAIAKGVPALIRKRRKAGMPSPFVGVIREQHQRVRAILLGRESLTMSLLPREWVSRMLVSPDSAHANFRVLYSLLILEVWHRLFITDRTYERPTQGIADLFEVPRAVPVSLS